ncbi:MAG TPA: hypothetical protein VFY37_12490 [Solirubrobacterales bacterium]|jgi:hypothetical protein|nr:hypothetical protein [Solirubrobacterales bacterium]
MGLKDRLVENRRRKLVEYVAERLETDDPVEASLPMTQSKNPLAPGVRFYGIAVLPSQVVVVGYPKLVEIPSQVVSTWDRELVGVVHHRHGRFGAGELFLKTPDGEFRVEVPRIHRDDADAIVAALGGAPPA